MEHTPDTAMEVQVLESNRRVMERWEREALRRGIMSWIKNEEGCKLPPLDEEVLISVKRSAGLDRPHVAVYRAYRSEDGWEDNRHLWQDEEVLAWQPWPKPYQD